MSNKSEEELTGVKEIARRANISIGTVDRVINNRPGVAQKTRENVLRIISELQYQPNMLARRLASKKTIRIATLIPKGSSETSFWNAPLMGIQQADTEINQFGVIVDQYFYDQDSIGSFVEQTGIILQSKPDGVLLAPSFIDESVSFTSTCKKLKIPYVLIDSDLPNQGSLSYIGPNLFHSGYLSAHLISYLIKKGDKVLIVNISKEIDDHHHLIKKEEGFRAYYKEKDIEPVILKADIRETDPKSIEFYLSAEFKRNEDIKVVFVTNSRVSVVAGFVEKSKQNVLLIGYDYVQENLDYLKKGLIDFLICQKPMEQAYRGVMSLYQHLSLSATIEQIYFMPIDIITKENYSFYRN